MATGQPFTADVWRRIGLWFLILAVLVVPFFLPIPASLRRHPAIGAAGDRIHIPLLFAATLLFHWRGPLAGRIAASALAAAALGAVIEALQIFVGRSARLGDFVLDLLGIGMAISWVMWRRTRRRRYLVPGGLLILAALVQMHALPGVIAARFEARERFPLLADFDSRWSDDLWSETYDSRMELVPTETERGVVLQLRGGPPGPWPGVNMRWFPADWSGYRWLVFDVRTTPPGTDTLAFGLRLDDWPGRRDKDWFAIRLEAGPQWRTYAIDVAAARTRRLGRPLDLTDLDLILFYFARPRSEMVIQIDNLRLTREEPPAVADIP